MKQRFATANTNMLIGVLIATAVVLAAIALARFDVFGKREADSEAISSRISRNMPKLTLP